MKKYLYKGISLLIVIVFLFLTCTVFAGAERVPVLEEGILDTIERIPLSAESFDLAPPYIPLWRCVETADVLTDPQTDAFLASVGVTCRMEDPATVMKDTGSDRVIKRIEAETAQIDLDAENKLVRLVNLEDIDGDGRLKVQQEAVPITENAIQSVSDLQSIILLLESYLGLDNYHLVRSSEDISGVWSLLWHKDLGNGLLNPFDAVVVTIDGTDGSISMIVRNTIEPNATEPIVTQDQAVLLANPVLELYEYDSVYAELALVRPNYYWEDQEYEPANFICLSWIVKADHAVFVYIDALTGEILGGDTIKGTLARAVGPCPDLYRNDYIIYQAKEALLRLGYEHHLNEVDYEISQADIEYVLLHSGLKGLYLGCHGEVTLFSSKLFDANKNWTIDSSIIPSGWKFVYLDACDSARCESPKSRFP